MNETGMIRAPTPMWGATVAALTMAGFLALASCGGGVGGGSAPAPPPAATPAPPAASSDPLGEVGTTDEERERLFIALADEVFAPAYATFRDRSAELATTIGEHCRGDAEAADTRRGWRRAMVAWQAIQHVAVGPVEEETRRFRIQFFPDRNEAVERAVDTVLTETDRLAEAELATRSVGVQGLPALEYLLFAIRGLDDPDEGPRRCELAQAVAANLSTMAADAAAPWQGGGAFRSEFVNAGGTFTSTEDVLTVIFEAAVLQAEFISYRKLRDAVDANNPNALESHYAQHSGQNIRANLDALREMFDTGADEEYRVRDYLERLYAADDLATQIFTEMSNAEGLLDGLEGSLEEVVGGQAGGDALALNSSIRHLADLLQDAGLVAGIDIGFNNQDGD